MHRAKKQVLIGLEPVNSTITALTLSILLSVGAFLFCLKNILSESTVINLRLSLFYFQRKECDLCSRVKRTKQIFYNAMKEVDSDNFATQAILFLLTSETTLWGKVKKHFKDGYIDVLAILPKASSKNAYALLLCAKDFESDSSYLLMSDLVDIELISDKTFDTIITAMKIYRYGFKNIEKT